MPRDLLTYRHPRTLDEAFGCDADSACPVHPDDAAKARAAARADRPVVITCLLIIVLLCVGMPLGWFK